MRLPEEHKFPPPLSKTFLHSCTVHFHSLTQLILLLLTPCSFGQNKRAYHETVSLQTAKNSKIKGRGKNYNSMQLRRMGRNHCADIWTQVSMPPWLALMGLLTQVNKPLPSYSLNDMVMELAVSDQTAGSILLWLTPFDLISLNSYIRRQITLLIFGVDTFYITKDTLPCQSTAEHILSWFLDRS